VAAAWLESEEVPYCKVKDLLKDLLLQLITSQDEENTDLSLLKMTLHNLAALNYIEMLEVNEKGAAPEQLEQVQQQLTEMDAMVRQEQQQQRDTALQIDIERREKLFKERTAAMKSRVKQTLKELNKRALGDPHSKLFNGRLKQQQMLDRHANRISHRQMLKDPTYRSVQRLQSPDSKLQRSSVAEGKKIVNLLKDTRLKHVDNVVTYSGMDLRSRLHGVRLPKLTVECFYE
jgi:hypothetical protein